MEVEEKTEGPATSPSERRTRPRYDVDEGAVVLLVSHGLALDCQVLDLSLEGCRIRTRTPYSAGVHLHVEVTFKVNGIAFRFSGTTQWTDGRRQVGIRFVEVLQRRREELAEVLSEVMAKNAAKAEKLAAQKLAAEREAQEREAQERLALEKQAQESLAQEKPAQEQAEQQALHQADVPAVKIVTWFMPHKGDPQLTGQSPARPAKRDRRTQSRHEVDNSAVILLIKVGSRLTGRIFDISLSGCRIRMDEPFPVGIFTRVETEFLLEGLPFRLGGVIQAVHDRGRLHVGIRFLDMSDRKRGQLEQLIEEIEELHAMQAQASPVDSGVSGTEDQGPNALSRP